MAIAKSFRLSTSYQALTTTETWARVALRRGGSNVRLAVSSSGAPSDNTSTYALWQREDVPFEIRGMGASEVLYGRSDGQDVDVDVAAGTP